MATMTPVRVALVATPFGFGPASKAYSIGCLLAHEYDIEVHYFGSDCALDFFAAQGLCARGLVSRVPERDLELVEPFDTTVNVLAPELISSPHIAVRTHYVDSLGFMWRRADLPPHSLLRQVRRYFAQDILGSTENLARLGIPNVTPVSGIVSQTTALPGAPGRDRLRGVVNLGGLRNPTGTGSAQAYLPLVEHLLDELQKGPYALIVAMNQAIGELSLATDVPVEQFSGTDFLATMTACDVVFSSPGMTTLVEASQLGRPYVPLPPQNWSQVVICRHMAAQSDLDIWSFLFTKYRGIDEREGELRKAGAVRDINRELAADQGFVAEYGAQALRAAKDAEVPAVGSPFEGAREVATAVAADLGMCGNPQRR